MARSRAPGPKKKPAAPRRPAATVDAEAMKRSESYLERGRAHATLETGAVKALWVEAFKRHIAHFADQELARAHEDLQAELRLRGEEPPFAEVEKEAEAFFDSVRQAVERVKRNPEHYAEATREIAAAMEERARTADNKLN